jgi:beta-galactosidase
MALPGEHDAFSYYGKGPMENYIDLHHCANVGFYASTAEKEYVPYVRPQDHGNHIRTAYATLRSGEEAVTFRGASTFEFSALHHKVEDLFDCQHAFELPEPDSTEVIISYKNRGIGSGSCVVPLIEKYRVTDKTIDFTFHIR